jgi:hypothetical protein
VITNFFGGTSVNYVAGLNPVTATFGTSAAPLGLEMKAGWAFICSSTVGQRGIFYMDVLSHNDFAFSALISPVLSVPAGTILKDVGTLEQLFDSTDSASFWARSSTSASDTIFNSASIPAGSTGPTSNGWTLLRTASDLGSVTFGPYFQLCVTYQVLTNSALTPAQIQELKYAVNPPGESSDNWVLDNDNTTQGLITPSYATWYLQKAYTSVVPQLFARVTDINAVLLASGDTSTTPTAFGYSTNGGTSWIALGTIPNVVGTRVRFLVNPTPSSVAFPSIRES